MFKGKFEDIVLPKTGFLRGPFGSALKKSLFVPEDIDTYKVYEQGVVLEKNKEIGNYYITKNYFDNTLKKFEVSTNDFLVSCSGVNYGAIYQLKGKIKKGVINQALLRVRLNNEIVDDNYFLYYFRTYLAKSITQGTGDSTIPNFPSMSFIKNIKVELPSLEIQKKIGDFLEHLDKKIELNNKINSELESMIQTIYDYWFMQFDFPNREGKPYKSSGGEMVWSEKLKREIPIGWEVQTVANNELTSIIKPGVEKFSTKTYLATGDVIGTDILKGNIIEYEKRESRANMQPRKNTIWFAKMKNSIKHLFLNKEMKTLIDSSILSTGFCGLECTENSFEYISSFISSPYFENIKNILSHGATQEAVNNNDLDYIFLIIPKEEMLIKYHNKTKNIYSKKSHIISENQDLTNLRDWLVPMLMNGQIKIK